MTRRAKGSGRSARTAASKPKRRTSSTKVTPPASSPVSAEAYVATLTRERDKARDQQAATSEIFQFISRSSGDLQPVLLRPRHGRPCRRATQPRDELAPSHRSSLKLLFGRPTAAGAACLVWPRGGVCRSFFAAREAGSWPESSVRCFATIRPKSGVKSTCHDSSTDAFDPLRAFARTKSVTSCDLMISLIPRS
jgi:hypothetical protein